MVALFLLRSLTFLEVLTDHYHLAAETLQGVVDISHRYAGDVCNIAGFPITVEQGLEDGCQL